MSGGLGFNKLIVMVPVMLAARKIDSEDPVTIYWLRVAYGGLQAICVILVLYTYVKAADIVERPDASIVNGLVYVPVAPTPFADPNAKKKYTEVQYTTHILSTARSLLLSTLFGIAVTVGLHWFKGMAMGLAMQTVMGPLNLFENPLVRALLFGNGFRLEDRIFDEKTAGELSLEDEIVDESGNAIVRQLGGGRATTLNLTAGAGAGKSFEEVLLDTWDAGNKAEVATLMGAVTKKNCNIRTKENGWTPLMILAGLNAKETASAIRHVKGLGGNPAITDADGWNAMHWAAFHGSTDAARELAKDPSLLSSKDKEGKSPLELAKSEGNEDVAKFLEGLTASGDGSTPNDSTSDGIRKRK